MNSTQKTLSKIFILSCVIFLFGSIDKASAATWVEVNYIVNPGGNGPGGYGENTASDPTYSYVEVSVSSEFMWGVTGFTCELQLVLDGSPQGGAVSKYPCPYSGGPTGGSYDTAEFYVWASPGAHTICFQGGNTSCSPKTAYFAAASQPATINVNNSQCSVATWTVNPGGYNGTSNSVSPGTYTIYPNVPSDYFINSITSTDGGSTMNVGSGDVKTFNIRCTYDPPDCSVDHFYEGQDPVDYNTSTNLYYGGGSNNACTSGTLSGGIYGGGTPLASNGYTYPGNVSTTGNLTSRTCYTYQVCRATQCESREVCVDVHPINACYPSPNPTNLGNSCTSSANACGQTSTGTIQCNGTCSASTPANPAGYGNSCTSSANACGQTNTGTIQCNDACSATTPSNASCSYTVSASAGTGGSISPSSRSVSYGNNTTFTVTPNSGYWIGSMGGTCPQGSFSGGTWTTGSITSNCSVNASFTAQPLMYGSLSASDCSITAGNSSCNSSLSWSTTNPVATSVVTTPTNITVGSGNSGSATYPVSNGTRNFYLYNNGQELVNRTATASCVGGTTWNGSVCAAPPPGAITVDISASPISMTLPTNSTNLTWTTTGNPTSCTASGSWSGAKTASGGSENRTGLTQGTATFTITCSKAGVSNATDTVWVDVNPSGTGITVDISASPTSMTLPTNSTNLTWTTTGNPTSCTASGSWSGAKTASGGSENRTGLTAGSYTYTITCSKSGVANASDSVTVQVNSGGAGSCSNIGSGGAITYPVISGTQYVVHTFTSSGSLTLPAAGVSSIDYLVIGGGGGGGGGESGLGDSGGGGGAGGYRSGSIAASPAAPYAITVGAGGSGGASPGNGIAGGGSSIGSLVSVTGGGRGGRDEGNGGAGGSGGGAGGTCWSQSWAGGSGVASEGNNGGTTFDPGSGPPYCNNHRSGSGGGGAGAIGSSNGPGFGGNGGAGRSSSITGSSVSRAGGGGGGGVNASGTGGSGVGGAGGVGAGGNGASASAGTGSGGGGGAGGGGRGGNGASGIVIARYACVPYTYPDLTASNPSPSTATAGTGRTFSTNISNAGPGSATPSFSNFFQVASDPDGAGTITDLNSSTMNALAAGNSAVATSPSYTFASAGMYSVRACADKSSATNIGTIPESNENNNCSGWTNVTVSSAFDYSISSPSAVTVTRGDPGGATRSVSTTLLSGSSQPVSIVNTTSSMPSGLSVIPSTCSPSGVPCTSILSIVAGASAPVGNHSITISGNPLGATTQARTLSVNIVNPTGITVTCSVDKQTAKLGETIIWTSNPQGGIPPYASYVWTGSGVPTPAPTGSSFSTAYSTIGTKTAQVTVTDSVGAQGSCTAVNTLINFDPTIIEF